ncbi:MAG: MBL fold metallo-hydrolase [Verrucomicrobiae bacterium]|nr:MBL fold metallo-hydrolase [Verrucomicrobiae bacterium]
MLCKVFVAGPVETNGYLIADRAGGVAAAIDAPPGVTAAYLRQAEDWQTPIRTILNTHGHWDHVWDNAELRRRTGALLGVHRNSAPLLKIQQGRWFGLVDEMEPSEPDFFLEHGQILSVGELRLEVRAAPGHCPGSVVLWVASEDVVFAGDVLFAGGVGRTDLPGGHTGTLLRSIREQLLTLPDNVRVLPGHGPATTIGTERRTNPFLVA